MRFLEAGGCATVAAILALALASMVAQAQIITPFKMLAGYLPRTEVDDYLLRDLIQEKFEKIMYSESCEDFDKGKAYWEDVSDPDDKGGYLQRIPTYRDTISTEWNEYIQCTGEKDFHIQFVDKAFKRGRTTYSGKRGNANWKSAFYNATSGTYGRNLDPGDPENEKSGDGDCVGPEEGVKKATAYMFGFLETIQLLQKAIDLAKDGCIAHPLDKDAQVCTEAIRAWDASAAIYVGSLEGRDGHNLPSGWYGKTLYSLADKRCDDYRSCGNGSDAKDDTANINTKIIALYSAGSVAAYHGDYREMERFKRTIGAKMMVPFVQGTLRYAYRLSDMAGNGTATNLDKIVAEGGTFGMMAGPKLWACSKRGYDRMENEIKIGGLKSGRVPIDFVHVKLAYECNYPCLGITCQEVGGLYDGYPTALPGAEACNDLDNGSSPDLLCDFPSRARRRTCSLFRGREGIPRRSRYDYYL